MKNFDKQKTFLTSLTIILICLCPTDLAFSQTSKKSKVFVLSTLHQFHGQSKFYSFETLSKIVEMIKPDVIAVELTPTALETRKEQKTKQEYQKSIFPLADKHKYALVPLEPAEPKFSELVKLVTDASKELNEKSPQKAEAFSVYSNALYDYLFKTWDSPLAVNSSQTDSLFEVKHKFQNALFGEKEEKGWEGWNQHFLDKILEAAQKNPGKKILVLVGAEHSYWLRKHLKENQSIDLIKPEEVLK